MNVLQTYKKMIRPFDIILIVLIICLSFIPTGVLIYQQQFILPGNDIVAIVSINGQEIDRFILAEDMPHQFVTYTNEQGLTRNQYNIIEVEGTRIRVLEDNSPDQIAVQTGWINQPGQMSICLPHRLIIRIEATNPGVMEDPEIIIAG